ncbi:MAG: 3-oxoacyl-[acyl-carrier-protein] synthase [Pseudomonadota bacterium]|nr:3-oxoacyl-[acyl-carrier-protein] synthase [Pseudomonadota bacterium]MDQ5880706.1 3-oxoacyl-[acyl-carrier-protein] synthase [Pseudomonadota bacterium]MDQ5903458.1 3-oxoacyl-[acyl-carrier-protein] synthase [Pseudomonadota bacterium]MDQ5906200.1 3-oxoacyl-[acyl-carrier-protein] synthase [Pseudomonadota bacterium]MDQ5914853.1 3-oxoacyl-[acyl-carrier-protein] synthase [Pseudomonadota bacterium]
MTTDTQRVVVTGMAGITGLGDHWGAIDANLRAGRNAVRRIPEWAAIEGLNTHLGAPIDFVTPAHYPRKAIRSMGRVSLLAVRATEMALKHAGLLGNAIISSGATGIAYGSSAGSVEPVRAFGKMMESNVMTGINATTYIQMMPHTTAVNTALHFGLKGRIIPTSSACTSGSQAIGYAYEAIRYGKQKVMVAGGAEELSAASAAVFDLLFATSTKNDSPTLTPRPFDKDRDGLVVGEGAATLVLEEYEHARARGATILAEIIGFGTNSDGAHITQPEAETMAAAMRLALDDANLPASAIGYVSAHGTATDRGDIAESRATAEVLGDTVPISSMKSYLGHTLGACGAIEAWWVIEMMRRCWFAPTLNLDVPDPACATLRHITGTGLILDTRCVMSNNFAFGGINTSLIFKRES